jgi:hypothetical protein
MAAMTRGTGRQLAALATGVVLASAGIAFFLAPDRHESVGSEGDRAPAAKATPKAESKAAPAPKAKSKPKTSDALAQAKRIEIASLSGSFKSGIAGKTAKTLKGKGFKVGAVTNAPGPADRSAVYYARGAEAPAKALGGDLAIRDVRPAGSNVRAAGQGARLIVLVGADR